MNNPAPVSRDHLHGDDVLLYNVSPWREFGFGVPNFGNNLHTLNAPAWRLASEIGQTQLYLMTHIDAYRDQSPSVNTIVRLGKLLTRLHRVLGSRMLPQNQPRLEEGHAHSQRFPWLVHPVPYFPGPMVRNHVMLEFNQYCMLALTNMYQHSDNNIALEITVAMASDVWRYFNRVKRLIGVELLGLSDDAINADGFEFTEELIFANYDPSKYEVRGEDLRDPGPVSLRLTEDDLRKFHQGIPAHMILPNVAKYDLGPALDAIDNNSIAGAAAASAALRTSSSPPASQPQSATPRTPPPML